MSETPTSRKKSQLDTSGAAPRQHTAQHGTELAAGDIDAVRRFHLAAHGHSKYQLPDDVYPALLWPFRRADQVRSDYPLLLLPPNGDGCAYSTLSDALEQAHGAALDQGRVGRVLTDNLRRLERHIRDEARQACVPRPFDEVFDRAAFLLQAELALSASLADELVNGLEAVRSGIPKGSDILGFGPNVELRLLAHTARAELAARRDALRVEISELVDRLEAILLTDSRKGHGARAPEELRASMGAGVAIDASKLSTVLSRQRAVTPMPLRRRERIVGVLAALKRGLTQAWPDIVLLHGGSLSELDDGRAAVACEVADDPMGAAEGVFERHARAFADTLKAIRIARLESASPQGAYDDQCHDPWFDDFDWEAFSDVEARLLPMIVAVVEASNLTGAGLAKLSELLLSGRRVGVLARVNAAWGTSKGPSGLCEAYRLELGYFGISHRQVIVHQAASARPGQLHDGFVRALGSSRASLHLIATASSSDSFEDQLDAWLFSAAAVESRAHPVFLYDPDSGDTWARTMELVGNPEPDGGYPRYPLELLDGAGAPAERLVPYSFADFALLTPEYRCHFTVVPEPCTQEEQLVPIDEYLALPSHAVRQFIPYTWGVDGRGRTRLLAMTRVMALACRDRLRFWRTLQELAGIHNEHVEVAVEQAVAVACQVAEKERQVLIERHEAELTRVRRDAAAGAFEALARALVTGGAGGLAGLVGGARMQGFAPPTPLPTTPVEQSLAVTSGVAVTAPATDMAEVGETEDPEEPASEDPWVDSRLCTSCNDCVNLNPLLFVYDANRQVALGDLSAGTYAQLVEAARKCPARCIHPGSPVGDDGPNRDELTERAREYH